MAKIKYDFVTKESVEITVTDELAQEIKELQRREYNNYQREIKRHVSLNDALDYGLEHATDTTAPEMEFYDELHRLRSLYPLLTQDQKDLIRRVFFNAQDLNDIAAEYGCL